MLSTGWKRKDMTAEEGAKCRGKDAAALNRSFVRVFFFVSVFLSVIFFVAGLAHRNYGYQGYAIKNGRVISEKIRSALKNRSWRLTITFRARIRNEEKIKAVVDGLLEDALYESDDPAGGDYIRYQLGGYEMNYVVEKKLFSYQYTLKLKPSYYSTREEEAFVDGEIEKILGGLDYSGAGAENAAKSAGGAGSVSDEAKLLAVHDYVTGLLSYDKVHKKNPNSHKKTTAYAALKYHRVVCQGYAVLTYRLLKELGIDCRIVTGDAEVEGVTERHAWLVVNLDGVSLGLDPTLDDITESYDWYLKPLSEFERDHTPDSIKNQAAGK